MIQELLGGGLAEDGNKICISGGLLGAVTDGPSSCSSPTSATSSGAATAATTTSTAATNSEQQQNLRCPRCDSTNTKFCYYNNYNLIQPRHFCKTCRRYWTKGGALRNVPIGGGCRKTKSNSISVAGAGKSAGSCGSKAKILASEVITGKSGLVSLGVGCGGAAGFDNETTSSSVLWGSPQNSHLLALLRATERSGTNNTYSGSINTIPNPSPCINPNLVRMKEEGPIIGSHLVPEASLLRNALNARVLGVDPLAQVPLGLSSSLWSNQYQYQLPQQQQQQAQQDSGFLLGEAPSSGALQELYLRLRSSGNGHYADHTAVVSGNVGTSSSSSSTIPLSAAAATTTTATTAATILEQTGVAGGEFGYWNSPFAWADMPTSNGAFL